MSKYSHLIEFLKIPSISTQKSMKVHVESAAQWVVDYLIGNGIETARLLNSSGSPMVYAEILSESSQTAKPPTLLFYGHYDVQPTGEESEWESAPFEPEIRDGKIYGRGTADDKGQVMAFLDGVLAAKKEAVEIGTHFKYNIKILLEGEEEIGSPHIDEFIENHHDLLEADYAMIFDSDMKPDTPQIELGLRGLVMYKLKISNAKNNLHSGLYGGAIANPTKAMSGLFARIATPDGSIHIPGFYDNVLSLDKKTLEQINQSVGSVEKLREETGAGELIHNEDYTPQQAMTIRPTFEINSVHAGVPWDLASTIIPKEAVATFSFRLVADQLCDDIDVLVKQFVMQNIPKGFRVELELEGKHEAVLFSANESIFEAAREAAEGIWPNAPIYSYSGGSIGVVASFKKIMNLPTLLFGLSFPDANIHGANENLPLEQYEKGIEFTKKLLLG